MTEALGVAIPAERRDYRFSLRSFLRRIIEPVFKPVEVQMPAVMDTEPAALSDADIGVVAKEYMPEEPLLPPLSDDPALLLMMRRAGVNTPSPLIGRMPAHDKRYKRKGHGKQNHYFR